MIDSHVTNRDYFHVQADSMRAIDDGKEVGCDRILPESEIPLGDWLLKMTHLSNKGKVALAYILARSAWQYYDSPWMMTPWTHDTICLLSERNLTADKSRSHPYLTRQFIKIIEKAKDVYVADQPNIRIPTGAIVEAYIPGTRRCSGTPIDIRTYSPSEFF